MKFTPSILDEIRARLPVSSVVGRRVKLTKAGREFKGLSPFNAEKSPSFFVNDQKGFYHDFSSGKHGDIFSFVMETEGLGFAEAVERLAADAGVALPKVSAEAERQEERAKGLVDVMALAQAFVQAALKGAGGGKAGPFARCVGRVRSGLCAGRAVCLARSFGGQGRFLRADDRSGAFGAWRGDCCAL